MNPNIQHLITISNKRRRLIIGLMSGTSLDGLDIALCSMESSGHNTKTELLHFETIPYPDDIKSGIRNVFAQKQISLEELCILNPRIALLHARYVHECLKKWGREPYEVDLIASHGQTVYHSPTSFHQRQGTGNASLQIGDGDHLAVATGIITISDFRQKHIAAGGEGAPLSGYGDYLLFSKKDEDRLLLNIGGIANFTYLPGSLNANEMIVTDTGPGNTLMDAFVREHYPGMFFDQDAALAKKGRINEALLKALNENDFFRLPFPKTTGPELFNTGYLETAMQKAAVSPIPDEDILATLNRFTAACIVDAVKKCPGNRAVGTVYCSGGGLHNPLLMQHLEELLPGISFRSTAALGINPDAKEAVLFALLANECIWGDPSVFVGAGMPAVSMGKISFPA